MERPLQIGIVGSGDVVATHFEPTRNHWYRVNTQRLVAKAEVLDCYFAPRSLLTTSWSLDLQGIGLQGVRMLPRQNGGNDRRIQSSAEFASRESGRERPATQQGVDQMACGAMTMTGIFSSIRAIGPCFNSPAA